MPTVTLTAGQLKTQVSYPAPRTQPKVRFGVDTLDWNESVSRIGPLQVARKYCGPGETLNEHLPFALANPSVHLIISLLSPGLDRALYVSQLKAWPDLPGGLTTARNHEPFGKKSLTPAQFVTSVLEASDDWKAAGSPPHVRRAALLNGWMESTQPWAVKALKALGGYAACMPPQALAALDVVGWDFYDDANYPNYGKGLGPGYKLESGAARALGWDKPFIVGESGSFDPANQKDFFDRLVKMAHPPTDVAWWDHDDTHSLVTGNLRTWFLAAQSALK